MLGRNGAKGVLKHSRARCGFVEEVYTDSGCACRLVECAHDRTLVAMEIVNRQPGAKGS
jgi:hypothetical protein